MIVAMMMTKKISLIFSSESFGLQNVPLLFRERECLIGLVLRSSVFAGLMADSTGAISTTIERFSNAKRDVPSDTKNLYSESIHLLEEIKV